MNLEILDFKEIEGDFAQKYFITIGIVSETTYSWKHVIHRELYQWAVEQFGIPSSRWNWRKTNTGGCFQFRDKTDCLLFRLQWIN